MRSRHVIAALAPVGAASALAILPIGASTAASTATAAVGHMTPEVSSPVAYTYVSKAGLKATGTGYLFSCQEPGAALNCYTPCRYRQQHRVAHRLEQRHGEHHRPPGDQGLGRRDRPRHSERRPPAPVPALKRRGAWLGSASSRTMRRRPCAWPRAGRTPRRDPRASDCAGTSSRAASRGIPGPCGGAAWTAGWCRTAGRVRAAGWTSPVASGNPRIRVSFPRGRPARRARPPVAR